MKYTSRFKHKPEVTAEKVFDVLAEAMITGYEIEKGVRPTEDQLMHGLEYMKTISKAGTGVAARYARIKCLVYKRPYEYAMLYESSTYHKTNHVWIKDISADEFEITVENIEQSFTSGGAAMKKKGDGEGEKPMGFKLKWDMKRMISTIR